MLKNKAINNKKGFTLIELIVAIAIFSILGIGAFSLMIMTSNVYYDTSNLNTIESTSLLIVNTIRADIYNAQEVAIYADELTKAQRKADTVDKKYRYISFKSGYLRYVNGTEDSYTNRFINGLYNNRDYKFDIKFKPVLPNSVEVNINVSNKAGKIVYRYSTRLLLHNVTAGGLTGTEGVCIEYAKNP